MSTAIKPRRKPKAPARIAKPNNKPVEPISDPAAAASAASLVYVDDSRPGITRRGSRTRTWYAGTTGKRIRDARILARIKSLVIPPAWTDVWICPLANGHLQATGRDAKGRKQYRYHARWRTTRDESKYARMILFADRLPKIRAQVQTDMAAPGLSRTKVLATVVRLLETTLIRVGNDEYARTNKSIGLTTMRDQHVEIDGATLHFEFRGKSGVQHSIDLTDRRLAKIVQHCQDIPGYELFQYVDESGERRRIDSADVNDYLHEIAGEHFTAKDFRTWAGTVLAALALEEFEAFDSDTQAKKNVLRAIESVAERLGNTVAVCRKCYVHPAVIDAYLDGSMLDTLKQRTEQTMRQSLADLKPEEAAVVALLQERLRREVRQSTTTA